MSVRTAKSRELGRISTYQERKMENVSVRRHTAQRAGCKRRFFVKRLGDAVAMPSARRTARMDSILHRLGLAFRRASRT